MKMQRHIFLSGLILGALVCLVPAHATTLMDLKQVFDQRKWDASVQMASEVLRHRPSSEEAIIKGAYALFQKGYANAALVWLKRLTPNQWKRLKAQDEGFAEVITLLQKKVPLTILPSHAKTARQQHGSNALHNEVLFSKGREAYEAKQYSEARKYLGQVANSSRYFSLAHYLLASAAVSEKKYTLAENEFSRIFEPTLFQQSTEFWKDLKTEMSHEMGASLKVLIDPDELGKVRRVGELGLLGMARVHYAKRQYGAAIAQYHRINPQSVYSPRAKLERIWALLQMNQHEQAEQEAKALSVNQENFEGVEANTVRAIILTDAGRTKAARHQLDAFDALYSKLRSDLEKYTKYGIGDDLPKFVIRDLDRDQRLQALHRYQTVLKKEIKDLKLAGDQYYPVYRKLATQLSGLTGQGSNAKAKVIHEIVKKRLKDLNALSVQSHLVRAETYLEDREQLRKQYKGKKVSLTEQAAHDKDLVELLTRATNEVELVLPLMTKKNPYLIFRQSELLWELGTAHLILSQSENKEPNEAKGERLRRRSLKLAQQVVKEFVRFKRRDQAMFFVGFAHLEFGEEKQAGNVLRKFVSAYPNHENVPDAYRILGDERFDKNKFSEALAYYRQVLKTPSSPILGYAYYKIAWSAYNLQDYPKAMVALEQAVLWAERSKTGARLLSLKKEARRDLITLYSEVGDAKKARAYFNQFIGGGTYSWLEDLAKIYFESGQYEKAIHLYNVLISLKDDPEKNLRHYTSIIQSHSLLLQWENVIRSTKEMINKYGDTLKVPVEDKKSAPFIAEKTVREASLAQHFEFKQTSSPRVVERILLLDNIYFAAFGDWPSSQDPLYKHAYFLYQKKRYKQAVSAFLRHWDKFNKVLKEPLREESLRNLVSSLEKVESKLTEKKTDSSETPLKLSPQAKAILKYAGEYHTTYGNKKSARAISFLRASILLKYERWEEGIAATQSIVDEDAKDKLGKSAFKNLRVAYYKIKKWDKTYEWASEMLRRNQLKAYHRDLQTIREEALFLWADRTTDHNQAADLFLRAANDPRMRKHKEKSLYNAIIRLHKADDRTRVLELSKQLEQHNRKSKSLSELSGIRAALYQEAGDYHSALPHLEAFLKNPGAGVSKEVVNQAKLNTALISQGLGKISQAKRLYKEYIAGAKSNAPGVAQASSALKYLDARGQRQPASIPFKPWNSLMRKKESFEKRPLPTKGSLGKRIKAGAKTLEATVKTLLDTSSDPTTPDFYAFESYCAVPPLYVSYADAVLAVVYKLPKKDQAAVKTQLQDITDPMVAKANELAEECIKKSLSAHHHGPLFRKINAKWGWEQDADKKAKVGQLLKLLNAYGPWLYKPQISSSESEIIQSHLNKNSSPDSWYALGMLRLNAKQFAHSRLTFIDALNKKPSENEPLSGEQLQNTPSHKSRILNSLAYIEWKTTNPPGVEKLFEKASEAGSALASVNMALIQLQQARLEEAMNSLAAAERQGAFDSTPQLKGIVQQFIGIAQSSEVDEQGGES